MARRQLGGIWRGRGRAGAARARAQADRHDSKTLYICYKIQDLHLLQDPTSDFRVHLLRDLASDFTDQIMDFKPAKRNLVRHSESIVERRTSKARRLRGRITRGGYIGQTPVRRDEGCRARGGVGAQAGGAVE